MWTSWIRAVRSWGTQMCTSVSRSTCPILPPLRPVNPTTTISRACAASTAASTLAELPLVVMATSTSPATPSAHLARENAVEIVVVGDGRPDGGVGGERNRTQFGTLTLEASHKFHWFECMRIAYRSAVAADQHLATIGDTGQDGLTAAAMGLESICAAWYFQVGAVNGVLFDSLFQHGGDDTALPIPCQTIGV